ncbi:hypothetical protein [Bdellovibrio bacteriovorus]|uniref:hypothetical protein n=1 Tax=Bdellovibrio bacteriovorus TaxID=959 RepID=UPI0035A83612
MAIFTAAVVLFCAFYFSGLLVLFLREKRIQQASEARNVSKLFSKYSRPEVVEGVEQYLAKNPDDFQLRKEILDVYFLINTEKRGSEESIRHVEWIVENYPSCEGPWHEWALHLLGKNTKELNLITVFDHHFKNNPDDMRILKNAAVFSRYLDTEFSFKCWERIFSMCPYDKFALRQLADLSYIKDLRDISVLEHKVQSFIFLKKYLSFPWYESDSSTFQRVRIRLGKYLCPKFVAYMFLSAKNVFSYKTERNDMMVLSNATRAAFEGKQFEYARKWGKKLQNIIESKYKMSEPEQSLLSNAYSILARVALYDEDFVSLKHYIKLLESTPVDSISEFLLVDYDLMMELKNAGLTDLSEELFEKRSETSPIKDEIQATWNRQD